MSFEYILRYIDLDFTQNNLATKSACEAAGLIFSDIESLFPDKIVNGISGSWSHSTGKGWTPTAPDDDKGPAILIKLCRLCDWEIELILNYEPSGVNEKGAVKIAAMLPSNHYAFFAMARDSSISEKQIDTGLYTNNGDDINTSRYQGSVEIVTTSIDWIIGLRNKNGVLQVYDDQDDAWHNYTGRQSAGRGYTASHIAIAYYKYTGANFWTSYLKSLKFKYL